MKIKTVKVKKFIEIYEYASKNLLYFEKTLGDIYSFHCFVDGHADMLYCTKDIAVEIIFLLEHRIQKKFNAESAKGGYSFVCLNKSMNEILAKKEDVGRVWHKNCFQISIAPDSVADKANEKTLNEWKIKNPICLDPEIELIEQFLAIE